MCLLKNDESPFKSTTRLVNTNNLLSKVACWDLTSKSRVKIARIVPIPVLNLGPLSPNMANFSYFINYENVQSQILRKFANQILQLVWRGSFLVPILQQAGQGHSNKPLV